jgi:hypothetical protein
VRDLLKVSDLNKSSTVEKKGLVKEEKENEYEISNRRISEDDDSNKKKLKHFQYVHFRVPLFKHPGVNLFYIFVPMWILGSINLLVFFQ